MARFLLTTPHTEEECLRALDEELAKGPEILNMFVYGCKSGDHTSYGIIESKNRSEALSLIPDFLQEQTCITEVGKFTPAEIKSFHEKAA